MLRSCKRCGIRLHSTQALEHDEECPSVAVVSRLQYQLHELHAYDTSKATQKIEDEEKITYKYVEDVQGINNVAPTQLTNMLDDLDIKCTGCGQEMSLGEFEEHTSQKHLFLTNFKIFKFGKFHNLPVEFTGSHCLVQGKRNSGKTTLLIAMKLFELALLTCCDPKTRRWKTGTLTYSFLSKTLGVENILHHNNDVSNIAQIQGTFSGETYSFTIRSFSPITFVPDHKNMPPPPLIEFSLIHFAQKVSADQEYTGTVTSILDRALAPPNRSLYTMITMINKNDLIRQRLMETMQRFYPSVTSIRKNGDLIDGLVVSTISESSEEWDRPLSSMGTNYKNLLLVFATIYYKIHLVGQPCVFLVDDTFLRGSLQNKLYDALRNVDAQVILCSANTKKIISGYTVVSL
jgi:hypothetical protein